MKKSVCFVVLIFFYCIFSVNAYAFFSDEHSRPSVFREIFRGNFEPPQDFSFDFSPIIGEGEREVFRAMLRFIIINPERTPGELVLLADGEEIFSVDILRRRQIFRLDLFGLAPKALADGRLALDFSGPEDVYLRRVVFNARARPSEKGGSEVPIPGAVWLFGSGLAMLAPVRRIFKK